jgi:hypothetical protein
MENKGRDRQGMGSGNRILSQGNTRNQTLLHPLTLYPGVLMTRRESPYAAFIDTESHRR